MKKLLLSILALACFSQVKADEGMWIPMLIGKNYEQMQKMGIKLSAEDLYNANGASLKDAIVQFGGGCTGEIISPKGLLITNHHCGYGNIAELSTIQNNYLEDGFWAKNLTQEIPAPGLSVKFLVSMKDVSDELLKALNTGKEKNRSKNFQKIKENLEKEASEHGRYTATVSSYFNGNQYILLVYQIFNDVRLVATPPKSLGKFGGDTDNWMWPRQTADFSIFRVYADKNNNPAKYAADNVPYTPKHHLPISLREMNENDYSMVMGYPGRTNRYETSYGVDMAINDVNPSIVKIRDMRLGIMRKYMRQDKALNLKLASNYARIANYWKYFIGQTEQLTRLNVIEEKKQQEQAFTKWANTSQKSYSNLMSEFAKVYANYRPYAKYNVYFSEAFYGSSLARMAASTHELHELLQNKKAKKEDIDKAVSKVKATRISVMKDFDAKVEEELFARTAEIFYSDISKSQHPDIYQKLIFRQFSGDSVSHTFDKFARYTFSNSFFLDNVKFEAFVNHPTLVALEADPAVQYAYSFINNTEQNFSEKTDAYQIARAELAKQYIKGLMLKNEGQLMYPDANSTMRITYGKVGGYSPKNGVMYNYYTTVDGLMEKYVPGDYEFDLPQDFLNLLKSKDYGKYANKNGELVANFITNNDITGGNSGSPMINAYGELTGLAFDGNWEAMSGDIAFDKNYKKTIAVDIRFVLWLVEKYGKANNLIEEMTLKR